MIWEYSHLQCGFKFVYYVGGYSLIKKGRMLYDEMNSGKWGNGWSKILRRYPKGEPVLQSSLCFCEKCNKYFQQQRIKLYLHEQNYDDRISGKSDSRYISEVIHCPDCYLKARIIKNNEEIRCPVCEKMCQRKLIGLCD